LVAFVGFAIAIGRRRRAMGGRSYALMVGFCSALVAAGLSWLYFIGPR
jgi:hypothetical protein